ncbi:molybdopterin-dependent oxidoreductase [Limisphaera ngatamarikiensis]|uniref:Molybdopterin-dependent oxidoreductase n=1 Tax=Limisphaera ngatamarikiensis TaxID=1324935 RepID=A0A6M1RP38_9BACT|nr:molybdopterin-dependent oxidoreductase [Limisphaera ngatamarikiensis]NGO39433.1 molybdopterin-dependent oxidoreductase [Limisphaera ngatamarikiensis]
MSTVTSSSTSTAAGAAAPAVETIRVRINGREIEVPRMMPDWQGKPAPTTMLQACELAGVTVPHYCYHPKLPVAGNCRMCLVEYGTPALGPDRKPILNPDGTPRIVKSPRPAIACATPISPGMEIYTDTPGVRAMRAGVLEFLLINHPLDCPICDQAGECKLQEYALDYGEATSRFVEAKVHKPKAVDLGPRIVFDAERCILCTRCIRFTRDIVGDDALGIVNRGSYNTIATAPGRQFDNNYTLNTVDICPVGALTSRDFRFRMRVWFLKETPGICPSCGTGCNILIGSRQGRIYRYTPRPNDAVNSHWMCDYGRLNYKWIHRPDRLRKVRIHGQDSSWERATAEILERLRGAEPGTVGIIGSARLSNEELWLLSRLKARLQAISDAVPREGEGDHLLLNPDRNPNTQGARLTGICFTEIGIQLPQILQQVRKGRIRILLVFGEELTRHGFEPALLRGLDLLVVCDVLPNATTELAHYLLPGCAPAEKMGTFTNVRGRVQRFEAAIPPPGDARPEWEVLAEWVGALTGERLPGHLPGLFDRMATEVPAFRGLTWSALGALGANVPV